MITAAQLDAAPVGSRVVFDWEDMPRIRTVYRKTDEGWLNTVVAGRHPSKRTPPIAAAVLAEVWLDSDNRMVILPPRKPAAVRVWSWRGVLGAPHYSWYCRVCADFDVCFADSDEAHDKARSHASLHAEVTAP